MSTHKPSSPRRRIALALAAAAVLGVSGAGVLIPSGSSAAGGTSVTLNLKGGFANHQRVACGDLHHYTYYHRRHRIRFAGNVSPEPSGSWEIKLKLKKCVNGTFVTVYQKHFSGGSGTHFHGHFRRRHTGFYFARAYYYGVSPAVRSDKQHFRVKR